MKRIRQALRFIDFVADSRHHFHILFTPYGEAMVHGHYREAMVTLSRLTQVKKVAVQTNASFSLTADHWLDRLNPDTAAFWLSWHPEQMSRSRFEKQYQALLNKKIAFSCGVVELKEYFHDISQLRKKLPRSVYLWINAYKRTPDYYSKQDIEQLIRIDPYFENNLFYYPSKGRFCRTGQNVFSVNETGQIRRCHFVNQILGNISSIDFGQISRATACPNETCHCHIGYIYLRKLHQQKLYGSGMLERIPEGFIYQQ
ncbi:STM4011 family radical SAM protein [uncultured Desulfobacter sp.]|uniref:STM4011 family radical SAM protein n=1 Tax=uncultured Desulfobacter sp. TaxID=240139 RepID=UPI002AA80BFE|nr:STM4011 family radical SAM protein [uncultured Desulfobacter sp.]